MRSLSLLCISLALPLVGQMLDPFQPAPFRRDQLAGRGEELNDIAFVHRISFEPAPFLGSRAAPQDNSLRGTAGSTSGDRLYLRLDARALAPLDSGAFAEYRFRRHEDFDGTFSRNLVGLGYAWDNGWRAAVFGDLSAEKEDVDTELEFRRDDGAGNRFIFSVINSDSWYNTKSEEGKYLSSPFTFFSSLRHVLHPRLVFLGFLQVDPRVRLSEYERETLYENEALSGGGGLAWTLFPDWTMEGWVESLGTRREQNRIPVESLPRESLDRTWDAVNLELRHHPSPRHSEWIGLRHFHFEEEDVRPFDAENDISIDRRETILYGGLRRPITDILSFEPALYLSWVDHTRRYPQTPQRDWYFNGFVGKFAPAFTLLLNRENGAHLTVNLSTRLDRMAFGGGNIQFEFPF